MSQELKYPTADQYPDGYNWFAYDYNGLGCFYKIKPTQDKLTWNNDTRDWSSWYETQENIENWKDTLRQKPESTKIQPYNYYYKWHPVTECIKISEQFPSNLGQAIQYIWRANVEKVTKGQTREQVIDDLNKAIDMLKFEIERIK